MGGHEGQFSRDLLPVSSAGGPCAQFWHGQAHSLFYAVHPTVPLLTMALPTLQGALMDGFGEAVVAFDMPEPCWCPVAMFYPYYGKGLGSEICRQLILGVDAWDTD